MDTQQQLDAWIASVAQRPRVFNHNLHLRAGSFRGFTLVNTVPMDAPPGGSRVAYVFARRQAKGREADEALLRVDLAKYDDTRQALLGLSAELQACMNPDIPRAVGRLATLADIGFAARSEGAPLAAATFTVGNVEAVVRSVGTTAIDVSAAAAQLARWLSEAPDDKARRAGLATRFAPPGVRLREGQALTLVQTLPEPDGAAPRIQVLAQGGTLRRDGAALVYVADTAGVHEVALFSHAAPARTTPRETP